MLSVFRFLSSVGLKVAAHYLAKKLVSMIDGWLQ